MTSVVPSASAAPGRAPVVLAIQNDATDPPLLVGEWLEEDGIRVQVVPAYDGAPVPRAVPEGVSGVLSLGGSMGAYDDGHAPWLDDERALIADAVDRGVPVLGLCLGGQLLAAATGGTVELGPTQEIGLVQVQRTMDGLVDPVMSQVRPAHGVDIPAAQWHQDFITELPDGAVLLLTNDVCRVQGFRLGDTAYGLQLHPELDASTFRSWADYPDEALARAGVDPLEAAVEVERAEADLLAAWRPMARAWGDLVWSEAGGR